MMPLAELKAGLASLPEKRKKAKAGDHFAAYLSLLKTAHERVALVASASPHVKASLPAVNCDTSVANAGKAARQAAQLREALAKDPEGISEAQTQRGFDALKQAAESAANGLKDAWARGIEAKLREKGAVVKLLETVLPQQGKMLKRIVTNLQHETTPPSTKESAKRVQDSFAELDRIAGQLDLDGPFGDFLRAAASDAGAEPKALLDPEVRKGFDKHGLWKSFRVRSS